VPAALNHAYIAYVGTGKRPAKLSDNRVHTLFPDHFILRKNFQLLLEKHIVENINTKIRLLGRPSISVNLTTALFVELRFSILATGHFERFAVKAMAFLGTGI
jgi:hypothetical protein